VNINPDDAAQVDVRLAGAVGRMSGQVLTAPALDARNRFGAAEEVRPRPFSDIRREAGGLRVDMPAKSIVVLRVEPHK
jgi:alpha-N-arabinofuranosidase